MKPETLTKKVQKFQDELLAYYTETDCEIPDVDSTFISTSRIDYAIEVHKVTRTEADGHSTFNDEWDATKTMDQDDLLEQLAYDRRRLRKGWRVWKSENPDAEMERDDE